MKIPLKIFALLLPYKDHNLIKNKLLELINKAEFEVVEKKDEYFSNAMRRCDWHKRNEEQRPWTQFIIKNLQEQLDKNAIHFGYNHFLINELWFQQYEKKGRHGWHVHGSAFTGVYYLELKKLTPLTELVDPFNNNKKITIPAKEGDMVIFPSGVIHQCPLIKKTTRKTIVSFNIDPLFLEPKTLKKVESL